MTNSNTDARGRVRAFMAAWRERGGPDNGSIRLLGVRESGIELLAQDVADLIETPTVWTDPGDGTTYDLAVPWRDADGDVWVCVGWLTPFDNEPAVPLMKFIDFKELPELISEYGPLEVRRDG